MAPDTTAVVLRRELPEQIQRQGRVSDSLKPTWVDTRSVPEDAAQDFLAVVRRVSARQDAELLAEPTTVEALPAASRRTEEVEPMVLERAPEDDEFDADALADFDRENPPE
jgi:hypothetical protein